VPPGFPGSNFPRSNGPPGFNGQQGNGQPGIQINPSAQGAAAALLQNLLTQPRPGGLQGITQGQNGGIIGGGIAGVASKGEGESIMVYGDRTDFSEWEFIYDPMKFRVPANPNNSGPSGIGVPAAQLGSNAGLSAPGTAIGTGPGGTQASGMPGMASGFTPGFGLPGGSSGMPPGQNQAGGAPPAGGGSQAFGQAGGPDIRPGKQ